MNFLFLFAISIQRDKKITDADLFGGMSRPNFFRAVPGANRIKAKPVPDFRKAAYKLYLIDIVE